MIKRFCSTMNSLTRRDKSDKQTHKHTEILNKQSAAKYMYIKCTNYTSIVIYVDNKIYDN